jgi:hypothetical protein
MDPKPIFNATILVTAVVYGFVLWIVTPRSLAALAGPALFGLVVYFMLSLSIFCFAYHVLREVALGRKYITPPDLESTNPVGEFSFAPHAALYRCHP